MTELATFRDGNAHGFVGPLKPPSVWTDKRRGDKWNTDFLMASAYTWGRMDAGEPLDVNVNYRFMNAWADMQWEYRCHYRTHLPAMWAAFTEFLITDAARLEAVKVASVASTRARRVNN
jgi:hypothetical protein